jgi:ABC-type cobalamin transport system permease subunit
MEDGTMRVLLVIVLIGIAAIFTTLLILLLSTVISERHVTNAVIPMVWTTLGVVSGELMNWATKKR